jgi:ABC-type amino acid transport substrate-binding protein
MKFLKSEHPRLHRARIAASAMALLAAILMPLAQAVSAGTLDRVRDAGQIRFGYRTDARPFSYRDDSGNAAGYSVVLCKKVAEQVGAELALPTLAVEWVPVTVEGRFSALRQGNVDLLCGADSVTLSRRREVAFSIPIFPGGIGAVLRTDAPYGLRDALSGTPSSQPRSRGSPAEILGQQTVSIIAGTTSQNWLTDRLDKLQVPATVVPVQGYEAGIQRVLDRGSNAFFGDRAILLGAVKRSASAQDLIVLDRRFTYEPIGLTLARGDEDFRLLVDGALSRLFGSAGFRGLYASWFGGPDEATLAFFRQSALPE